MRSRFLLPMIGIAALPIAILLVSARAPTPAASADHPAPAPPPPAAARPAPPALPPPTGAPTSDAAAGELSRDDLITMDRTLARLTEPCRASMPALGLVPPVNLPYLVTVGIARGRARIIRVEVDDSTASSELAQALPPELLRCVSERLRTQEWEMSGQARDQVHVHMTALNWR